MLSEVNMNNPTDTIDSYVQSQLSKRTVKPGKGQTAAVNYVINRTLYFLLFYFLLSIIQICLVS